jgi:hypothetical protein
MVAAFCISDYKILVFSRPPEHVGEVSYTNISHLFHVPADGCLLKMTGDIATKYIDSSLTFGFFHFQVKIHYSNEVPARSQVVKMASLMTHVFRHVKPCRLWSANCISRQRRSVVGTYQKNRIYAVWFLKFLRHHLMSVATSAPTLTVDAQPDRTSE